MGSPATSTQQPDGDSATPVQPMKLSMRVYIDEHDGRYQAVVPEYTVTGVGATEQAALDDVLCSLVDYLNWCLADGMTLEQARRPISKRWYAKLVVTTKLDTIKQRITHHSARAQLKDVSLPDGVLCLP
jgi:hypothetical protein